MVAKYSSAVAVTNGLETVTTIRSSIGEYKKLTERDPLSYTITYVISKKIGY